MGKEREKEREIGRGEKREEYQGRFIERGACMYTHSHTHIHSLTHIHSFTLTKQEGSLEAEAYQGLKGQQICVFQNVVEGRLILTVQFQPFQAKGGRV